MELLALLRMINAVVPDTFFLTPPLLCLYLPHLESIKDRREEGEKPTTGNVFTVLGENGKDA